LLGGKFRDEVRIYLDCHAAGALEAQTALQQPAFPAWAESLPKFDLPPDKIISASAQRAGEMAQLGYTALKFDLDLPGSTFDSPTGYPLTTRDIDWMVTLTNSLREAVGPDVDLAVDAHWRYRANDILQVMKQVEPCRLMWFEDPVPSYDEQALTYLRNHTSTPIGTGEHLQLRKGFWNLIVNDLCDVVTPDLQRAGGLAEGKKIADMCATTNKSYAPHMIGSPIALMGSAHLGASIPNFTVCEFHAHDVPFFHELVIDGTESWFRPGWVKVLDKPGLGIELNETVGKQYKLPGSKWFDEH
jgi:L-alanine-DL-glutamate epimerase-like enolase superfamily enzyme